MTDRFTSEQWLQQLKPRSRILLINPYVQDVRYPWVRWNQPVDLLKLAALLTDFHQCDVELVDCMLPSEAGRVADRYVDDLNTGERYRTFGMILDKNQRDLLHELNKEWPPDYVVLSTLTSYWGPRVVPSIRSALRSTMPQVQVVLSGPFAVWEPDRASRSMVDVLLTTFFATQDVMPKWNLYNSPRTRAFHNGRRCHFAGLTFHSQGRAEFVVDQVRQAKAAGINSFVFFVDDLFKEDGAVLENALGKTIDKLGRLDIRGLCGITPSKGTEPLWTLMLQAGFRSVHLEYDTDHQGVLRLDDYHRACRVLRQKLQSGDVSGFVMVGCPGDDLNMLVQHTLDILATCGSIIPKPYTPSPMDDRGYYDDIVRHVKGRLDRLGPRSFPLEGHPTTSLTKEDFEEFFGLTTELNKKLQGRPFDLFDESAITDAFRSSLNKGVWKLAEL